MDIIKRGNKKGKIANIKFNNYNLIIFMIFFLLFSLEESKCKIIKLNLDSEILIIIKGPGNYSVLNKRNINGDKYFNYTPSEIYINGVARNRTNNFEYNLELEDNIITLKFNQPLKHCNWMFYNLNNIIEIQFLNFDSSNLTEMIETFGNCNNLVSLNLSVLDTSKVINVSGMFSYCNNLKSLDLSNFNTKEVINMGYFLSNCFNLISIDLSNFNTISVINMEYMFSGCSNLATIDLSHFNTSLVKNMNSMFSGCSKLISLDLSHLDTSSVMYM